MMISLVGFASGLNRQRASQIAGFVATMTGLAAGFEGLDDEHAAAAAEARCASGCASSRTRVFTQPRPEAVTAWAGFQAEPY
jgi:hypothetical protein